MIRGRGGYEDGYKLVICIDIKALEETCQRCPFSLVCLSGKQFHDSFICSQCEAIWVDEIKALVDCDGFEPRKGHQIFPGCPACEPFEEEKGAITKIVGYCGQEQKENWSNDSAADEE